MNTFDYDKLKTQYAEPKSPKEAQERKLDMMSLQFEDLADRIDVETTDDKKRKNKGHDRAAELSNFLRDFSAEISTNAKNLDKQKITLAGHLLKMSKQTAEAVTTIEEKFDNILTDAFSKFNRFE